MEILEEKEDEDKIKEFTENGKGGKRKGKHGKGRRWKGYKQERIRISQGRN